jgi:hypothetical protein
MGMQSVHSLTSIYHFLRVSPSGWNRGDADTRLIAARSLGTLK